MTPEEDAHANRATGAQGHLPALRFHVFEQLKQRNVFRVALLYLVVCWLILEPVHVIFHMLDVPIWANRLVVMIMAVGFPAVAIFAWVYEMTPEGLKPTIEVPHGQSIRKLTGRRLDVAIIAVLAVALAYFVVDKFWISNHLPATQPVASPAAVAPAPATTTVATATPFVPPPHSVAVLPFINLSGDPAQEYFSDGLTEELLNSLARIDALQVAARTSAFSFKGADNDIGTIGRKLNVGAVLEGSVRRSEHTVRVTVQLINTVTGFHLWSQTYDRDLGDVLKLETEIANATARGLKITLQENKWASIDLGGTHNAMALDAYLRGRQIEYEGTTGDDVLREASVYTEAIRLDPKFALAFAMRSISLNNYAANWATGSAIQENLHKAELDARQAIALAPDLAVAHLALRYYFESVLDLRQADAECARAATLEPNNPLYLYACGIFAIQLGRTEAS